MTYLLLRDNKQSGPYSLEDLKTKGLKAYDLVWVEGRSAAWRYPSEIDELSVFAPAVEEQPFDRFYKKPAAAAGSTSGPVAASQPAAVASSGATRTSQPFYSEDQPAATRKRTIYVTMPGGTAAPVTVRETVREPIREITREPVRETVRETVQKTAPKTSGEGPAAYQPSPAPEYRPAAAALPIDDYAFSEPIAGKFDNSRFDNSRGPEHNGDNAGELMPRSRPQHKAGILQAVLIGVGILVLLASGIFIGLSINKNAPGLQKLAAGTTATDISEPITHTTASPLPVPPIVSPQAQPANTTATTRDRDRSIAASGALTSRTGKIMAPKQKAIMPKSQAILPLTTTAADSSTAAIPIIHREAVHRAEADNQDNQDAAGKGVLKVNLASQVSVDANRYEVGTFGGISNLQVTVANRSAYPLDVVVVEVQYIQANKKTYKTENLYFHGVGPGMTMMQEAPKSSRGVKVVYKITQINSKELGSSEPGL